MTDIEDMAVNLLTFVNAQVRFDPRSCVSCLLVCGNVHILWRGLSVVYMCSLFFLEAH